MTNQPPTNQQIVIEFLAKTSDVLKKYEELNKKSEEAKQKIIEVAKATGASFREVADAMKIMTKEDITSDIVSLRDVLKRLHEQEKNYARMSQADIDKNKAAIAETTRLLREEQQAGKEAGTVIAQGQRAASQEAKELGQSVSGTTSSLQSLAGGVGALVGITSLIALIQKLLSFMADATNQAFEFSKGLFSMGVGVRALQRVGVDITMKDMALQIEKLREKFGVFSTVDLVQGAAAFLNLNRDMGFTKDQLFELQEAIATLAVVNGRSMDEVQKTVALALSSGYTEGLQRLGVSINRVTIAEEAARLGWEGGYTALNEQQRALATYNLVIEKTAVYQKDLLEYQKTLPGQIESTTKKIQDQTVALGRNTLALQLWLKQAQLFFIEGLNEGFVRMEVMFGKGADDMQRFVDAVIAEAERVRGKPYGVVERATSDYMEIMRQAQEDYIRMRIESGMNVDQMLVEMGLADAQALKSESERRLDGISQAINEHLDDILKLQEEFQEDSEALREDYLSDMQELWEEHWAKEKEIFDKWASDYLEAQYNHDQKVIDNRERHAEEIADIEQKRLDDLAKAQADYDRNVGSVWSNYNNRVAQANQAFRNKEEDAEAKFQERMRRLREGFLLDLEDAIRTRNARQVLTLIRRYNLDVTQAQRDYEEEKRKMWRDYQQQLADLARQRDERLSQLYQELQLRLKAIQQEYERELAEEDRRNREAEDKEKAAWEKKRRDLADEYKKRSDAEDAQHAKDLEKRDKRYEDDLQDLKDHLDDRYEEIGKALANEITLTDAEMGNLLKVLTDTLGPGGEAQAIYDYYIQYAQAAAQAAANALAMHQALYTLTGSPRPQPQTNPNQPYTGPHARGGLEFANTATTATYGEAGPETALFVPLNRTLSALGNSLAGSMVGGGGNLPGGGNGKAAIEIALSPGLEAKIVDSALDSVADVIIRRLR